MNILYNNKKYNICNKCNFKIYKSILYTCGGGFCENKSFYLCKKCKKDYCQKCGIDILCDKCITQNVDGQCRMCNYTQKRLIPSIILLLYIYIFLYVINLFGYNS